MSPSPVPSSNAPAARRRAGANGTSPPFAKGTGTETRESGHPFAVVPVEPVVPPANDEPIELLLVDDAPDKLLALEAALSDLGHVVTVVKATSGPEALRLVLKREFAVILLDINMPGMDGFETAALIRQRKSSAHTPIIFITSFSTGDVEVYRGYSLGAVD